MYMVSIYFVRYPLSSDTSDYKANLLRLHCSLQRAGLWGMVCILFKVEIRSVEDSKTE